MATKSQGLESYLPYKLSNQQIDQLVYIKTNIAGYFFDAFIDVQHNHKTSITSHPVQSGANVTDHAYVEPVELTMKVKMSDVMQGLVRGQFSGSYSRSTSAYNVLRELQKGRIPFQVVTRLEKYQNMMIETLTVSDSNDTLYGLEAIVGMKQIIVAEVKTIKVSGRTNVSNSTNRGTVSTTNFGGFKEIEIKGGGVR